MHVSATMLKNNLGQYFEASIKEPVIVEKNNRPAFVVMSFDSYQKMQNQKKLSITKKELAEYYRAASREVDESFENTVGDGVDEHETW